MAAGCWSVGQRGMCHGGRQEGLDMTGGYGSIAGSE